MKRTLSVAVLLAIGGCTDQAAAPPKPRADVPARPVAVASTNYRVEASDGRMLTQVGAKQSDGRLVSTGMAGMFMFGPYAKWPAGKYTLVVYGELTAGGGEPGWVDVFSSKRAKQFATTPLKAKGPGGAPGVLARLDFSLDQAVEDLEVRSWVAPGTKVAVTAYEVSPAK